MVFYSRSAKKPFIKLFDVHRNNNYDVYKSYDTETSFWFFNSLADISVLIESVALVKDKPFLAVSITLKSRTWQRQVAIKFGCRFFSFPFKSKVTVL